jgi:hypothetical protein
VSCFVQRTGIAAGVEFIASCPELLPINDLKVQDNNKKPNSISSAETPSDSELQPKISTSSHTCSNTHVSGWLVLPRFDLILVYE